jgi:hypothetical protein
MFGIHPRERIIISKGLGGRNDRGKPATFGLRNPWIFHEMSQQKPFR